MALRRRGGMVVKQSESGLEPVGGESLGLRPNSHRADRDQAHRQAATAERAAADARRGLEVARATYLREVSGDAFRKLPPTHPVAVALAEATAAMETAKATAAEYQAVSADLRNAAATAAENDARQVLLDARRLERQNVIGELAALDTQLLRTVRQRELDRSKERLVQQALGPGRVQHFPGLGAITLLHDFTAAREAVAREDLSVYRLIRDRWVARGLLTAKDVAEHCAGHDAVVAERKRRGAAYAAQIRPVQEAQRKQEAEALAVKEAEKKRKAREQVERAEARQRFAERQAQMKAAKDAARRQAANGISVLQDGVKDCAAKLKARVS